MRDNIHELPAFIELAAQHEVGQVIVDDLSGWLRNDGGNFPATDHPDCPELLDVARRDAERHGMRLTIHERLREIVKREAVAQRRESVTESGSQTRTPTSIAAHLHDVTAELAGDRVRNESGLACCGWIDGVWVGANGSLHPCCMVQGVADMGRVQEGPLHENLKYRRVKDALLSGRVFEACRSQRMCAYVQQQIARGVSPDLIDDSRFAQRVTSAMEDEGDLIAEGRSTVSLPVLY